MTAIAFDGTYLAADMQGTYANIATRTDKSFTFSTIDEGKEVRYFVATAGEIEAIAMTNQWLKEQVAKYGRDFDLWDEHPDKGRKPRNTTVVIHMRHGRPIIWLFVDSRFPETCDWELQGPMAWGSGRDMALGAMRGDGTAKEAIRFCVEHHVDCGKGLTWVNVRNGVNGREHVEGNWTVKE